MLWSRSLETGMEKIDAQHKQLFEQMDILLDSASAGRHKEVINFLDQYIIRHFSDEQKMHAEFKYPKASAHKGYHEEYVKLFREIKERFLKEGLTSSVRLDFNKTVAGWLITHILHQDKDFAKFHKSLQK